MRELLTREGGDELSLPLACTTILGRAMDALCAAETKVSQAIEFIEPHMPRE